MAQPPLPQFSTSGVNVVAPSSGLKATGWIAGSRPPSQIFNWIHKLTYDWLNYLAGIIPDGPVPLKSDTDAVATARLRSKLLTGLINYADVSPSGTFNSMGYMFDDPHPRLLIVGTLGSIQSSDDFGRTWTPQTNAGSYTGQFYRVMTKNVGWLAVGSAAGIQTASAAGVTWTARTAAGGYTGDFFDAAAGNGKIVAVGRSALAVQYSGDDGATWAAETPVSGVTAIAAIAGNDVGTFVYVDSAAKKIGRSANGTTWTSPTPASNDVTDVSDRYVDVKYSRLHGKFFALATNGSSHVGWLHSSTDGSTWTTVATLPAANPKALIPTRYGLLIVSTSDVHLSVDGSTLLSLQLGQGGLPATDLKPQNYAAGEYLGADQYSTILIAAGSGGTGKVYRSGVIVTD